MNKSVPSTLKNPGKSLLMFRGTLIGLLIGVAISIVPVCGIRRTVTLVTGEPAQVIFFAEWIIVSAITGGALLPKLVLGDPLLKDIEDVSSDASSDTSPDASSDASPDAISDQSLVQRLLRRLLMPLCATLFLLLYFAATALCQRLDMGVIHGNALTNQIFRYAGLIVASVGLAIQTRALMSKTSWQGETDFVPGAVLNLRHPCFFATIVTLTGLPLLMGTWYPLFAIPGIFIVMKWVVAEQERILREKHGDRYAEFQARTKRLIPGLY